MQQVNVQYRSLFAKEDKHKMINAIVINAKAIISLHGIEDTNAIEVRVAAYEKVAAIQNPQVFC